MYTALKNKNGEGSLSELDNVIRKITEKVCTKIVLKLITNIQEIITFSHNTKRKQLMTTLKKIGNMKGINHWIDLK